MGPPPQGSARQQLSTARVIAGLVLFSIVLLASVLAVSIATLVHVYHIEERGNDTKPHHPAPSSLNIPSADTITRKKDADKFKAYTEYTGRIRRSLDLKKDPCDNFYEYACGNFPKNATMSFVEITISNLVTFIQKITNKAYLEEPTTPLPVVQSAEFFDKCVEARQDWATEVGKGERLLGKMKKLEDILHVHFPVLKPDQEIGEKPDPTTLASVIAHMAKEEYINTFVTTSIEPNWEDPHGQHPYILMFDQATLSLSEAYYTRIWSETQMALLNNMFLIMKQYADFTGAKVDDKKVFADAKEMLYLEYEIGKKLNTREAVRRQFKRSYNVYDQNKAAALISPHLNFEVFLRNSLPSTQTVDKFIVKEPVATNVIMDFLFGPKVSPRTLYNYFFYRLLIANVEYLPMKQQLTQIERQIDFRHIGIPRSPRPKHFGAIHNLPTDVRQLFGTKEEIAKAICANENAAYFPYANGRVFLDAKYPKQEERKKLRQNIRTMIASVVDSFKGMLAQLNWMTLKAQQAAYYKIDNLVTNAAWPDFIENNEELVKYYAGLKFDGKMSYTEMVDNLMEFQSSLHFNALFNAKDTDRKDFLMSPSIVNAWYQPEMNSITFPLGILAPPFYDENYPTAVNYGAIGLVAGHELSHGFDDQGIQWDGTGVLKTWMDDASQKGFDQMAQCVVDEYSGFEPVKGLKIDGTMTQGENIADNGGLRSAFRAYRTQVGLLGPDPQLPDPLLGEFTQDQLFFLSFAQVWCEGPTPHKDLKTQLLIDPHSPSKYRILGSIQNFPAFRAAFNCPLESTYAPEKHCQVWETESKAN